MTKSEVIHFMEKIKAYYQTFAMEQYVVNEWYDKLKSYDINDVYKKLDEHLSGEYKNEIPKLHYITKYLKTPTEKKNSGIYNVRCIECGKTMRIEEYDSHIARHNSIRYIKANENKIGKTFNVDELFMLSQNSFDKLYDLFIEKLYDVLPENEEKLRLRNIILISKELND